MKRLSTLIIVLIIVIGLGTYWYEEQQAEEAVQTPTLGATPVVLVKVKRQALPRQLQAVGTLKAWRQIAVASQLDGEVTALYFKPGSYVAAGARLLQLDDRIARAKLASANSALHLATMNYQRAQSLAHTGAESKQALDKMRATFHEAKAAVDIHRKLLSETSITAPFAGYVGVQSVNVGDYLRKGQTITTLTDRSQLRVTYQLPERYWSRLKLAQSVILTLPNQSGLHVSGKVNYIAPTVNPATHSILLQAIVDNSKNQLTPGLFVRVQQTIGVDQRALVVPEASIVSTITGPMVYVVRQHKATQVSIKTGIHYDGLVEVQAGLRQGDQVVVAGQQALTEGAMVKEVGA